MTLNDDSQDRELLQRYARASDAHAQAPSEAVRQAILQEGRRVAAALAAPAVAGETERRRIARWKMTAWGAAAAVLLAALIIAPRFWNPAPPPVAAASAAKPFNQAASKSLAPEPDAEPRPLVPVVPVPGPRLESITPRLVNNLPTLRQPAAAPPPVHIPEQSVTITPLSQAAPSPSALLAQQAQLSSLARARTASPRDMAGGAYASRGSEASTAQLNAAAAAGDVARAQALLDQGAAINDRDAAGRTPLMLAIGQNQIETVRLLLARGADPNLADQEGLTPLRLARQGKRDDIAAMLIEAGAR